MTFSLPASTVRLVMHFRLAEGMVMPAGNAVSEIMLVFRDDVLCSSSR
jgi:hypothetical protein